MQIGDDANVATVSAPEPRHRNTMETSMTCFHAAASAVIAAALVCAAPTAGFAAKAKLMPQAHESVSPSADGAARYQASKTGVCNGAFCFVLFGKKADKIRRITDISCLLVSSTGNALGALITVDGRQISYLPLISRGTAGTYEYASGALSMDFEVLGGEQLKVEVASGGTASDANCVISGTIE
jgi:hypothetical protein